MSARQLGNADHPYPQPRSGVSGAGSSPGLRSDRDGGSATSADSTARPSIVCARLLAALEGSEGRRKRRKRDTTPDTVGLGIKRDLLAGAVAEDPEPADFEGWLLERCLEAGPLAGATRAMALEVLDEWRIALAAPSFRAWLEEGAPSDDRRPGPDGGLDRR